ncbi:MAG: DUF3626 domain-containing protein [Nannocystaceae bacterium]
MIDGGLTAAQRAALEHIRGRAQVERDGARAALIEGDAIALVDQLREFARIHVHFHPDRRLADGRRVADGLLADGRYRSQFETGLSNGSRTAFPGGERDRWEEALFGGAYHRGAYDPGERPRYGGLDLLAFADGACPRFGSCYLVLRREVLARTTFCLGDSNHGPRWVGTIDAIEPVLAARIASLGPSATAAMRAALVGARTPGRGAVGRALDDYVEAQVHGDLELRCDVEAMVVDPSLLASETGATLTTIAERFGIPLAVHPGFAVAPAAIPDAFRSPAIPALATRLVAELGGPGIDRVDAAMLGRGAAAIAEAPERWPEFADADAALQAVKQLWHALVAFGDPPAR